MIDRHRLQIAHRGELRLRRLKIDEISDAGFAVEPVGRRHLPGARQRRQGVVRDIGLRQRRAQSKGAMRGDEQGRLIERLTDRRVRDARDEAHLRDDALRVGHVGFGVAANDLYVNRCRQAEV